MESEEPQSSEKNSTIKIAFKKPVLVGKIGQLPRKMGTIKNTVEVHKSIEITEQKNVSSEKEKVLEPNEKSFKTPAQQLTENSLVLPYKEPKWSGLPLPSSKDYVFEVLKSGVIVEQINLMSKPFWVFGRSTNCEICMAHPTVSRYHAVLQYRSEGTDENPKGFYIYDLSSTHGTFLNKGRLKSRVYAPLRVGHMIKLGCSTRSYVLTGPDEDCEAESELSLTELKIQRAEKLLKKELEMKEALAKEERDKEERQKRIEEKGVDWGLGEDADEESDLAENPFAQTNNEELYIDDPKKALRGFMEREGYSLEYDCTEQGFGQFLCKVELPLDDDHGHRIVAEVLHKGKKKEAVVQCALEACRILDRHGVLRQATHESRKRKGRNWEENDFYDSDDDTFLDRTGTIEKKREKRMNAKVPQQPETYQSLVEKEKSISIQIAQIENQLMLAKKGTDNSEAGGEDPLDSFMKGLKELKPDKQTVSKLKSDLVFLKTEHINIIKLVNLAKPADLPPLVPSSIGPIDQTEKTGSSKSILPLFGKRKKIKVSLPQKPSNILSVADDEDDDERESNEKKIEDVSETAVENANVEIMKSDHLTTTRVLQEIIVELEKLINSMEYSSFVTHYVNDILEILLQLKIVVGEENTNTENGALIAKKGKMKNQIEKLIADYDKLHAIKICKELQKLFSEIRSIVEIRTEVNKKNSTLTDKLNLILKKMKEPIEGYREKDLEKIERFSENVQRTEESDDHTKLLRPEEYEKRKKKNLKRTLHRKEKNEIEKQKGYQEDAQKEDYNMWVPPVDQTGDGRTTLNEKYGY
ncbi:hypothetical protein FQR65_LT03955 [Abscondita terminalis]|nr:hypothetical protein FQR65_LT03955 [Abscondita terminalis]